MGECKDCGAVLKGRTDKKFCNDHCRSNYNNIMYKNRDADLKNINAILRKNLAILKNFYEKRITNLSLDMMLAAGFNFHFFTHELWGPQGEHYHCCYHFGYLKNSDLQFLIRPLPLSAEPDSK